MSGGRRTHGITRRRRAAFAVTAAMLGIVVTLGAVEVVARALEPGPPPPLLFRLPRRFMPRFEAQGLDLAKPPGEFRIVALGDSMSWGWRMHPQDAWPARLEWRLRPLVPPRVTLEVVNAARPNWNSIQEAEFVHAKLDVLEPDAVVLGFCLNDTEPAFDSSPRDVMDRSRRRGRPVVRLSRWLHRVSVAYRTLWERLENARLSRAGMSVFRETYDESGPYFRGSMSALKSLRDELDARDVPLLVAILPMFNEAPGSGYRLAEFHHQLERACARDGLDCIDLLPVFDGHDLRPLSVDPPSDIHPNEIGQRMIADALVGPLVERGMVPVERGELGRPIVHDCAMDVSTRPRTERRRGARPATRVETRSEDEGSGDGGRDGGRDGAGGGDGGRDGGGGGGGDGDGPGT